MIGLIMHTASPVFFIVIVAICAAIVGGLLASVVFLLTGIGGGGKGKRRPSPSPQPGTPASPDEHELLRVSRTKKGDLAVFVQGRPYRHLQEVTDPQIGIETAEAVNAVMGFARGLLLATQQSAVAETAAPKSSVDEAAFLEQLRQSTLFPAGKPSGPRPRRASKPEPLRTPAEEINDLIQRRLERWPDLLKEKVSMSTRADGSLCIQVGLWTFGAVDEITDPQARALVKDAIREWENTQRRR
jgi:hypothetical protein